MDAIEGRIRALERMAYGADATDAERTQAVAELAELAASAVGRDDIQGTATVDGRGRPTTGDAGDVTAAAAATESAPYESAPARARLVRWTVAAGGIGLLLGAAIGWNAGQGAPADSAFPAAAPPSSADPGTPLEESDLLPMFDRLPLAEESARVAAVDDTIDPASVRLLATRVDGPAAYLARTVDGENVCLVLMLPAGPSRSECTVDGLLPGDGLSILYGAQGYGLSAARLAPTGTVSLGLIVAF